jgi:hypothetical protein
VTAMPEGVVSGDTVLTEPPSNSMGSTFSGTFKVSGDKMTGPFKTDLCRGKSTWRGNRVRARPPRRGCALPY